MCIVIHMYGTTKVTTKGQVTIPTVVREALNISIGDSVLFKTIKKEEQEIVIRVIKKYDIMDLHGILHNRHMRYIPIEEARHIAMEKSSQNYRRKKKPA